MSLFKKPKKNLRQRIAANDEEEEGESHTFIDKEQSSTSPASGNNKPSAKPPKITTSEIKKKTSILSFQEDLEEDEGVETFQIKKSSQSRRIAKRMERDRKQKEQEQKIAAKTTVATESFQEEKSPPPEQPSSPKAPKDVILSGREAEMAGYRSESDDESADEGIKFRRPDPFRNLESRARKHLILVSADFSAHLCCS